MVKEILMIMQNYLKQQLKQQTKLNKCNQILDIDGFDDFGKAADELSELFSNFTKRLQNINIINDVSFLQSVLNALKKFGIYQRFLVNLKIQLQLYQKLECLKQLMIPKIFQ